MSPNVTSLYHQAPPPALVAPGGAQGTESDIFTFLAGTQPRGPQGRESGYGPAPAANPTSATSCGAELPPRVVAPMEPATAPTRQADLSALAGAPSTGELNMILKLLQQMVPEFPKLEPGEPGTRAHRVWEWLQNITTDLEPAGPHPTAWWTWVKASAGAAHQVFLETPLETREQVFPANPMP